MKLDAYEKELLEAYESGKLVPKKATSKQIKAATKIAGESLKKNRRITIRLYEHDYTEIQKKAFELGMPYQTLISSMIHQFVEGNLVTRK